MCATSTYQLVTVSPSIQKWQGLMVLPALPAQEQGIQALAAKRPYAQHTLSVDFEWDTNWTRRGLGSSKPATIDSPGESRCKNRMYPLSRFFFAQLLSPHSAAPSVSVSLCLSVSLGESPACASRRPGGSPNSAGARRSP